MTPLPPAIIEINCKAVYPSPHQARREFPTEEIDKLAASIRKSGLLQPILVRRAHNGRYEIIAGQRRWMACQRLGHTTIPAMVRDVTDREAAALTLEENTNRTDLTVVEEALAVRRICQEFCNGDEAQAADLLGRPGPYVTARLALANLAPALHPLFARGSLNLGHALELRTVDAAEQPAVAELAVKRRLSVSQLKGFLQHRQPTGDSPEGKPRDRQPRRKYRIDRPETAVQRITAAVQELYDLVEVNWGSLPPNLQEMLSSQFQSLIELLKAKRKPPSPAIPV